MRDFCFATIASHGYVDQAAGLWLNLREVHPDQSLLVCTLDGAAETAFRKSANGLAIVTAEEVWGAPFWRNMGARMNRAERAYATKAALAAWVLEHHARSTIVLDSDLLFLAKTPDLIARTQSHDVLLVAARHALRSWRKTHTFGLFSAGIVGFSEHGLQAAKIWRALCFDETRALPADGLYNEQKYLDYLIGFYDVAVVRDWGINVSPTILQQVEPYQAADKRWLTRSGDEIRIFHYSRSTRADVPFVAMKDEINRRGLAALGLTVREEGSPAPAGDDVTRAVKRGSFARFIAGLRPGRFLSVIQSGNAVLSRLLLTWHRILTQREKPLSVACREAFHEKHVLKAQLDALAFDAQSQRAG